MNSNVARLVLSAVVMLLPLSAQAQDGLDSWQWRATIYGWLPKLDATTSFPTDGDNPPVEVGVEEILDNLDFTFMGALHAHKGRWGIFTDILYLDEGADKTELQDFTIGPGGNVPGSVELKARLDLKSTLWTIGGSYALSQSDTHLVDLVFGARMVDMSQELDWSFSGDIGELPLPGRDGKSKLSDTNWDAIIGFKGYNFLGEQGRWVVPWEIDIGTGDSDFVWQAMAGIGYHFNWGEVLLTYRYLDYDNGDNPISDLVLYGPVIGASFAW